MNKKGLSEADIRTKFITPALAGSDGGKWNVMTQLREKVYFTKGRVIVRRSVVVSGYPRTRVQGVSVVAATIRVTNRSQFGGLQRTSGNAQ